MSSKKQTPLSIILLLNFRGFINLLNIREQCLHRLSALVLHQLPVMPSIETELVSLLHVSESTLSSLGIVVVNVTCLIWIHTVKFQSKCKQLTRDLLYCYALIYCSPLQLHKILDILELALSQNNHEVQIYKFTGGKWEKTCTLDEHVQRVNGIDWAPNSNRIVTCGAVC